MAAQLPFTAMWVSRRVLLVNLPAVAGNQCRSREVSDATFVCQLKIDHVKL